MINRLFKNWSLSWRLALLFVVIMVATYASVWTVSDIILQQGVEQQIEEELVSDGATLARQIEEDVRKQLAMDLRGRANAAVHVLENLWGLAEGGNLTLEEARLHTEQYLLKMRIGPEGYFYALDTEGKIVIHPHDEAREYTSRELEVIQAQLALRTGFIEYRWQNPGDESPRNKVAYLSYFEPLGWVISASQYLDNASSVLDRSSLEGLMRNAANDTEGVAVLLEDDGRILASVGTVLLSSNLLGRMQAEPSGRGRGLLPDRPQDVVAWYPIEGTGWRVALSGTVDPTGGVVARLRRVLLLTGVLAVVLAATDRKSTRLNSSHYS